MLTCWSNTRRLTVRPYCTRAIRHTNLDALKRIGVLDTNDKASKITDWFSVAKDRATWESKRKGLQYYNAHLYMINFYCMQPHIFIK